MDVGITRSNKSHPVHFISGLLVLLIGYSAAVFAVRPYVVNRADAAASSALHAAGAQQPNHPEHASAPISAGVM